MPIDAVSIEEAAGIIKKSKQAIHAAIKKGALPVVGQVPGVTGKRWVTLTDVRRVWPDDKRGPKRRANLFALSDELQDEILGFTPNVAGAERRPRPINMTERDDG